MGILTFLTDIFESIFMASSPEVKKKQALHKIDQEVRLIQPAIYKNGFLQPNFAELFRILYENSKILDDLLSQTISSTDVKRKIFFESQLLLTGFSGSSQEKLESLNITNRKKEVKDSNLPMSRVFENQKHTLEFLLKELNTPEFLKIDQIIASLQQLADICRFNYLNVIHNFDPNYSGLISDYKADFFSCVPEAMAGSFLDFYYLTAHFKITSSLGRAVVALAQVKSGGKKSENAEGEKYLQALKKISSVLTKFLTPENQLNLIRLAKHEPDLVPKTASYKIGARQRFYDYLREKFISDETRIKTEIKDSTISNDLEKLFGGTELEEFTAYNAQKSANIRLNCTKSYEWITPLQIEKTFADCYFTEQVKSLLEDIVIEGFFENPSIKKSFSDAVYGCQECVKALEEFDASFQRSGKNDQAIIEGFIRDGQRDEDFIKKLESTVDNINEQAYETVQSFASQFFDLYKQVGELFIDSKKVKPDLCSNIKVLLGSSRNRENSNLLETQLEKWAIFLEIMKNYAIVGEVERK